MPRLLSKKPHAKEKKKKLLTLNTSAFHCGAGDKIEGLAQ
jgi:hypothetical protein